MEILIDIFKELKKKWWIIVFIPLISTILSVFYVKQLNDEYTSFGQLSTGFTIENQLNGDNINLRNVDVKFNNIIQNIRSKTVINLLSYRLIIHDLSKENAFREFPNPEELVDLNTDNITISNSILEFQNKLINQVPLNTSNPDDKYLYNILKVFGYGYNTISENLKVYRLGYSDYIELSFTSENPNLSAYAVNALCEEFIKYNNSLKESSSSESASYLEKMIADKEKTLIEKTNKLNRFKSNNEVINYTLESQAKLSQIESLENQKAEEERKISVLNYAIGNINKRLEDFENRSQPGNSNQNELIELRNKISLLNESYINSGMQDRILLDSLESLRKEYIHLRNLTLERQDNNLKNSVVELENEKNDKEFELAISKKALEELESELNTLKSSLRTFAAKEVTIESLQREVDMASEEYLSLLDQMNDFQKDIQLAQNELEQVLMAEPPDIPQSSKKIMIVVIVLVLTSLISLVGVSFKAITNFTIQGIEKAQRLTNLDFAGQIVYLKQKEIDLNDAFNTKKHDKEIELYRNEVRKLRHELLSSEGKKCFLATSTKPKEGKTFVVLSLAYSLATINKKILVIDTNFKNNSLTRLLSRSDSQKTFFLNNKNNQSLNNTNKNDIEDDYFRNYISSSRSKNIDLIRCNSGPESPIEVFSHIPLAAFITHAKKKYDFIFMEGPNLNDYSDTRELSSDIDGILLVLSAQSTIEQNDKASLEFIKRQGKDKFNCILNKVKPENII